MGIITVAILASLPRVLKISDEAQLIVSKCSDHYIRLFEFSTGSSTVKHQHVQNSSIFT